MECRKISLKFKRTLTNAEERELIAYFKGFMEKMKGALKIKRDGLDWMGKLESKVGGKNIALIQSRIDLLLKPVQREGRVSCLFDEYFSLDFEKHKPLVWAFTYPHPQTIFGMAGISGQLRRHGLNTDAHDKLLFRGLVKDAGLEGLLDDLKIELVEK